MNGNIFLSAFRTPEAGLQADENRLVADVQIVQRKRRLMSAVEIVAPHGHVSDAVFPELADRRRIIFHVSAVDPFAVVSAMNRKELKRAFQCQIGGRLVVVGTAV